MESDILVVSDLPAGESSPVAGAPIPVTPVPAAPVSAAPVPAAPVPAVPTSSAPVTAGPAIGSGPPPLPPRLSLGERLPLAAPPPEAVQALPQVALPPPETAAQAPLPPPPPGVTSPPMEATAGGANLIPPPVSVAAPPLPPQAAVAPLPEVRRGRVSGARQRMAHAVSDAWDWVVLSGVWWLISAMAHATVLLLALLVIGKVIAPAIESEAPTFEAAVNAVVDGDEPDLSRFELSGDSFDASAFGSEMSAEGGGLDGESGEAAAALAGQPRHGAANLPSSGSIGSGSSGGSGGGGRWPASISKA